MKKKKRKPISAAVVRSETWKSRWLEGEKMRRSYTIYIEAVGIISEKANDKRIPYENKAFSIQFCRFQSWEFRAEIPRIIFGITRITTF